MKTGQLSTEYLVILGVVVVIALIVITVLGGFIDIGAGAGTQATKAYWQSADIGILSWNLVETGNSAIVVRNNQEYNIKVNKIGVGTDTITDDFTLPAGKTKTVTAALTCTKGDAYAYQVYFEYDDVKHGITGLNFTGTKNLEGTCN